MGGVLATAQVGFKQAAVTCEMLSRPPQERGCGMMPVQGRVGSLEGKRAAWLQVNTTSGRFKKMVRPKLLEGDCQLSGPQKYSY